VEPPRRCGRSRISPARAFIKYGTAEVSKMLLEHKLVDEYHFWLFPEVVGSGERLLDGFRASLELVDTTRFKSGIVVLEYAPK
jgi:dihydrofolate reductase